MAARYLSLIWAARAGATVAAAERIWMTLRSASASIAGIACVSGMFFQYFIGISDRIASSLIRAGLKMLVKYVVHSASDASSGRSGFGAPGPSDSSPPMKSARSSGVRIVQSMSAKRRAKKGALRATMKCSGSNQAAKRRRGASVSAGNSRKRTKARILWLSRRTDFASASIRAISGSAGLPMIPRSCRSRCSRR